MEGIMKQPKSLVEKAIKLRIGTKTVGTNRAERRRLLKLAVKKEEKLRKQGRIKLTGGGVKLPQKVGKEG